MLIPIAVIYTESKISYQFLRKSHLNRRLLNIRIERSYFFFSRPGLSFDLSWKADS